MRLPASVESMSSSWPGFVAANSPRGRRLPPPSATRAGARHRRGPVPRLRVRVTRSVPRTVDSDCAASSASMAGRSAAAPTCRRARLPGVAVAAGVQVHAGLRRPLTNHGPRRTPVTTAICETGAGVDHERDSTRSARTSRSTEGRTSGLASWPPRHPNSRRPCAGDRRVGKATRRDALSESSRYRRMRMTAT